MNDIIRDKERNRFSGRLKRYARVGTGIGGIAVRAAGSRLAGRSGGDLPAEDLGAALGGLKGPLMKVAQLAAHIPGMLPSPLAEELVKLQAGAPPMGWPFVKRRMRAELGETWLSKFSRFDKKACAAASLGQVHKADSLDGRPLACKLQYPDMESAVEADLKQLGLLLSVQRRMDGTVDTSNLLAEIGERLREELDYQREARHMALYRAMLADHGDISVPDVLTELSTRRLLTMTWLGGTSVLDFKGRDLDVRNRVAATIFRAWWHPLSQYAVIHGDPHLGNYSVRVDEGGLNLLDFGCIRIFTPGFVEGVIDLYLGILHGNRDRTVAAYEKWGFSNLSNGLIDALNIWASFIYGPLADDRVRSIADGVRPEAYGRAQAVEVYRKLRALGPVKPPGEFVLMDRAAIGLGAVFLHLGCELNFYRLFNEAIDNFKVESVGARQREALARAGLAPAETGGTGAV